MRNHLGLSNAGHGSSPRLSHGAWAPMAPGRVPGEGAAGLGCEQVFGGCVACGCLSPAAATLLVFDTMSGFGIAPWWNYVGSSQCCGKGSAPAPSLHGAGLQLGTCCRALRGRCTTSSGCQKTRDLIVLTIRWHRRLRPPAGRPSARCRGLGPVCTCFVTCPGRAATLQGMGLPQGSKGRAGAPSWHLLCPGQG